MTRKKLIEVALPLEAINVASAREKSIRHGHPSTLHLWWARRPLAAARAVIFTSLVDDPDNPSAPPQFVQACRELDKGINADLNDTPRMRLFDFIEKLVQWESTTNETILEQARHLIRLCTDGNPPPLLDPFAGGGSIPLEAQRLGLEAHASDLNPVAVMINKAQIEIPPRFANRLPVNPEYRGQNTEAHRMQDGSWRGAAGLAADVRYYGAWMREKAWQRIGHLYPTHKDETVIAWLWARTVVCPNPACGCQMPLVRSFELSKKANRRAWVVAHTSTKNKEITFTVQTGNGKAPEGTVNRRGARCLRCDTPVPFEHVRAEGKAGRMGAQLMAIVTEGHGGRSYYAPDALHETTAHVDIPAGAPDTDLPEQALGFRVQAYGMTHHRDLFTPRQLVALTTFSDLVSEAREQVYRDALAAAQMSDFSEKSDILHDDTPLRDGGAGARAYAEAVSVYLAFAVDKGADYWSSVCSWHSSGEKMRNTFGRQAIAMVWDYAECNAFSDSTGNWMACVDWTWQAIERTPGIGYVTVKQQDATTIELNSLSDAHSKDIISIAISTDPPYYDNIGYADLSDYFYVWLRRTLGGVYPELFSTVLVPKAAELVATPYRFDGDRDAATAHFENGMVHAFTRFQTMTDNSIPLTVYYAFKQSESEESEDDDTETVVASSGWETMLSALVQSRFVIDGTWPIRTELANRSVAMGTNALASSIVLVCRPRAQDAPTISRRQFVDALRRELPAALKELQSGNIAPVDLAQASIGPGMAVYSRYSKVVESDGSPLTVRAALALINQELDAYLAEQDGAIDPVTRFAVAWFEQYGFGEGEFGVADVLARAKDISVAGIVNAGVAKSGRGKVQLVHWREYDPGAWDPQTDRTLTVWEAAHHLIERLNSHGEEGAGLLLAQLQADMAAEARNLAYRLYNICERKGWADHARDYNALVVQWMGAQEQAKGVEGRLSQGGLFG